MSESGLRQSDRSTEGYEVGQRIGDYEILGILGSGGMGRVYKLRNIISHRIEAMKVLLADLESQRELFNRFLREIRVVAALRHPNITGLLSAQRDGNRILMIMDFVDGQSLDKVMQSRRLSVSEIVHYATQVLDALAYAHEKGVVHRDIKPQNILITPAGDAVLTDFGIAIASHDVRLTRMGSSVGSLHYMSPEQVRGDADIDGRSDLYSIGTMLYEMVTGRKPISGSTDFAVITAQIHYVPPAPAEFAPEVPVKLSECIMTAIAKDRAARFQSAGEMRAALDEALRTPVVPAQPSAAPPVASEQPPARHAEPPVADAGRKRFPWTIAAVVAALVLVAIVGALSFRGEQAVVEPTAQSVPSEPPVLPVEKPPQPTPLPKPAAGGAPAEPGSGAPSASSHASVSISSEPGGAAVTVAGTEQPCTTPCTITLPPGRHTMKASLAGYRESVRVVTIPEETQMVIPLTAQSGSLAVASRPPGAAIFVNGKQQPQQTPAILPLPVGSYKVEVRKESFPPFTETVEVKDQTTRTLEVSWSN